jgi:hypothetical protein
MPAPRAYTAKTARPVTATVASTITAITTVSMSRDPARAQNEAALVDVGAYPASAGGGGAAYACGPATPASIACSAIRCP